PGTRVSTELFKTDGTAAGTGLVKDLNTNGGSNPVGLTDVNGQLFFLATTASSPGVWKSDGTGDGTVQLASTRNVLVDARSRPVACGGLYYFLAQASAHGYELWKS